MPTVPLHNRAGAEVGTVELPDEVFGIEPNVPVMHQVVTAQLAARRSGTAPHASPARGRFPSFVP